MDRQATSLWCPLLHSLLSPTTKFNLARNSDRSIHNQIIKNTGLCLGQTWTESHPNLDQSQNTRHSGEGFSTWVYLLLANIMQGMQHYSHLQLPSKKRITLPHRHVCGNKWGAVREPQNLISFISNLISCVVNIN